MIFIDASAYLSTLIPSDSNRQKAIEMVKKLMEGSEEMMTSYAILGEVLTVGSQRYNRKLAVEFVKGVLKGKTKIVLEDHGLLEVAFKIFKEIKDKDVSWVDCFSFAIIKEYKVEDFFSFDKDFKKFANSKSLI